MSRDCFPATNKNNCWNIPKPIVTMAVGMNPTESKRYPDNGAHRIAPASIKLSCSAKACCSSASNRCWSPNYNDNNQEHEARAQMRNTGSTYSTSKTDLRRNSSNVNVRPKTRHQEEQAQTNEHPTRDLILKRLVLEINLLELFHSSL